MILFAAAVLGMLGYWGWRWWCSADLRKIGSQIQLIAELGGKKAPLSALDLAGKTRMLDRLVLDHLEVDGDIPMFSGKMDRQEVKDLLMVYFRIVNTANYSWADVKITILPGGKSAIAGGILTANVLLDRSAEYVLDSRKVRLFFKKHQKSWYLEKAELRSAEY